MLVVVVVEDVFVDDEAWYCWVGLDDDEAVVVVVVVVDVCWTVLFVDVDVFD